MSGPSALHLHGAYPNPAAVVTKIRCLPQVVIHSLADEGART
jgi:hypothetical protein